LFYTTIPGKINDLEITPHDTTVSAITVYGFKFKISTELNAAGA